MKLISIITPCYNEEANVDELHARVRGVMETMHQYRYEHIFIDNASIDGTVTRLRRLASLDPRVRVIVNARNFGHIRSPIHGLFQAQGDAMIGIVADLQDPPELIPLLIQGWEEGAEMVRGIKRSSEESSLMFWIRKRYYRLVSWFSSIETFENYTGFGLYSRRVVEIVKAQADPYPYFRGMIAEIGLPHKKLFYDQPVRKRGITKNNFYTLYDIAMLGIINHSKVPLRLMVFLGFGGGVVSFAFGLLYTMYKLFFWNSFSVGVAPLLIGNFFIFCVMLIFMGILGEYVGAIHTQIQQRPLVVEKARINFPVWEQASPLLAENQNAENQDADQGRVEEKEPTTW